MYHTCAACDHISTVQPTSSAVALAVLSNSSSCSIAVSLLLPSITHIPTSMYFYAISILSIFRPTRRSNLCFLRSAKAHKRTRVRAHHCITERKRLSNIVLNWVIWSTSGPPLRMSFVSTFFVFCFCFFLFCFFVFFLFFVFG